MLLLQLLLCSVAMDEETAREIRALRARMFDQLENKFTTWFTNNDSFAPRWKRVETEPPPQPMLARRHPRADAGGVHGGGRFLARWAAANASEDGNSSLSGRLACCPSSCGQCGGPGCSKRPGGRRQCCAPAIIRSGRRCTLPGDTACSLAVDPKLPVQPPFNGAQRFTFPARAPRLFV